MLSLIMHDEQFRKAPALSRFGGFINPSNQVCVCVCVCTGLKLKSLVQDVPAPFCGTGPSVQGLFEQTSGVCRSTQELACGISCPVKEELVPVSRDRLCGRKATCGVPRSSAESMTLHQQGTFVRNFHTQSADGDGEGRRKASRRPLVPLVSKKETAEMFYQVREDMLSFC